MKRILVAAAAFVVAAATAYAAPTVKTRLVTLKGDRAMVAGADPGIVAPIMTDDTGMTLYTFTLDTEGAAKANCSGQCAMSWPPFIAAAGATPDGDWTIVDGTDRDGTTAIKQWAYKGMPIYYHVGDKVPGEATGEFAGGDIWRVIKEALPPPLPRYFSGPRP